MVPISQVFWIASNNMHFFFHFQSKKQTWQNQEAGVDRSRVTESEEANTKGVLDLDLDRGKTKNIECLLLASSHQKTNTGWITFRMCNEFLISMVNSYCRKRSRSSSSSNSDSDAGSRRSKLGRSKLSEVERLAEIERQRAAQNARVM